MSAVDLWTRDLRHAARALRRAPGFTLMAVGTLGLAIGATAGMFSVVNTVLLNPLPYPHADRLVSIAATAPGFDLRPGVRGLRRVLRAVQGAVAAAGGHRVLHPVHDHDACGRPRRTHLDVGRAELVVHDARRTNGARPPSGAGR